MKCTPHQKRGKGHKKGGGQTGPTSDGTLRIVTDLLDVPAHVIAFLYQYRWMIEVFFRFFKQILGCRHLLSSKPEGVQIQIYAAVICCMLLNILTGTKPTKWHVTLMALYLQGLASEEDVLRELNKPDRTRREAEEERRALEILGPLIQAAVRPHGAGRFTLRGERLASAPAGSTSPAIVLRLVLNPYGPCLSTAAVQSPCRTGLGCTISRPAPDTLPEVAHKLAQPSAAQRDCG